MKIFELWTEAQIMEEFYSTYLDDAEFDASKIGYVLDENLNLYIQEDDEPTIQEYILSIFHHYKEKWLTFSQIWEMTNFEIDNKQFRFIISVLRDFGHKIVSIENKGYILTEDKKLLSDFVKKQYDKANAIKRRYENWIKE